MLPRIRALRRHLATELGFIVPAIHITDNMRLKPREYVLRLRGVEIARGETYQDWLLAISSEAAPPALEGIETREPAFGVPARWIPAKLRDMALGAGYAVVEQTSVIATHLAEVIRRHAHEVLTRQETKRLLDSLAESQPKLVEELVPRVLSLGEVEKILQQLLREQVSIRNLPAILETLIDASAVNRNIVLLVEAVRQTLGRALVQPLLQEDGKLKVLAVDAALEDEIARAFDPQSPGEPRAGATNQFLAPDSGRLAAGCGRPGGDRLARAALRQSCALSFTASAGAFRSADRGDFAGGNPRDRSGAIVGRRAMKSAMKSAMKRALKSGMKQMPRQSVHWRSATIWRRPEQEERT